MTTQSVLTLNFQYPSIANVSYAVQGDRLSRQIEAHLVDGSTPWIAPAGTYGEIRIAKPDGTVCFYDTLEDGTPAITFDGSTVTLKLAEQALTAAGEAKMSLSLYNSGGSRLTTFRWTLVVTPDAVADNVISGNYISVMTATLAQMAEYAQEVKAAYGAPLTAATAAAMTDTGRIYVYTGSETGYTNGNWYYWDGSAWVSGGIYNSTAFETDPTLTISGAAADAKAAGDAIGAIREVVEHGSMQQLVKAPFVVGTGRGEVTALRSTLTLTETGLRATFAGGSSSFGFYSTFDVDRTGDNAGHKMYYNLHNTIQSCASFLRFRLTFLSEGTTVKTVDFTTDGAEGILTLSANAGRIMFMCSTGETENDSFTIDYIQIIDLTRTFGAGNEPTLDIIRARYGARMPLPFSAPVLSESYDEEITLMAEQLSQGIAPLSAAVGELQGDVEAVDSTVNELTSATPSVTWESGNISVSSGEPGSSDNFIRTLDIPSFSFSRARLAVSTSSEHRYVAYIFRYFADSSFTYETSPVLYPGNVFTPTVDGAERIRFVVRRSPQSTEIAPTTDGDNLAITASVRSDGLLVNKFRPYTPDYIRFTVSVNTQFPTDGSGATPPILDGETMQDIWCILKLPENYDPDGDPVPLIMFSHGTGTSVSQDSNPDQLSYYFTYVGDGKCAVFDCNGMVAGSGPVEGMNMGGPIAVQAFHKAFEYITAHYNVRKDLVVGGNSMGGLAALNFINSYPNLVRCAVLAYPVTGLKSQAWDDPWRSEVREALALAYGFADPTGATWEPGKVVGYDPEKNRAVVVDNVRSTLLPVPVKIWHGTADTASDYQFSVDYINSVRNAGVPAYLRPIDGGGHGETVVTNAYYREAKYFVRRYL